MSLYNMFFGKNANTEIILAILELKENDIERFRDCGFEDGGIYIYTRTGGNNRDDYPNEKLTSNPYYLGDEDDDYDCTYATFHFKFPEEIKDDCEKFKNVKENGISAKLIQWVLRTLEREKTEDDIYCELYKKQATLVCQSKQTFIVESNGYIIVPLDESSLEEYLSLMEQAGGKQLSYSVMPYKIEVKQNVFKWDFENNKLILERERCQVKIDILKEIDIQLWNRWEEKYSTKFPKAIACIKNEINN